MNGRTTLQREAAISAVINGILSVFFFLLVFGYRNPPALIALGRDFPPQAFMVSLMGSLIPALILRRIVGGPIRPIVLRAITFAIAAAVVAGGGAFALAATHGDMPVEPLHALAMKVAFGAILGAIVTPLAVRPLLGSEYRR